MTEFQTASRLTIGRSLVQFHIVDFNQPLVISFAPAGKKLSSAQVHAGESAWGIEFFKKHNINVLSINTIDENHFYLCDELTHYLLSMKPLIERFPERLGYGSSMGGFGVTHFSQLLQIDRALLFAPLLHDSAPTVAANHPCQFTVIYDPFCLQDTDHAKRYPAHTQWLKLYGVGHQVIESISNFRALKPLVMAFINNTIDEPTFYQAMRQRRTIERYYSYLARNPTKKQTLKRRLLVKYHLLKWIVAEPSSLVNKLTGKWMKSINKRMQKRQARKQPVVTFSHESK